MGIRVENIELTGGIRELPENEVKEQIAVFYEKKVIEKGERDKAGKRQRVLCFGKRIREELFETDKKGNIITKEEFGEIYRITYIKRV